MRVREVEAIPLDVRLRIPFRFGNVVRTSSSNVLIRIATDDGVTGYGEACPVPQLTAETRESVCATVRDLVAPLLIDRDLLEWRPLLRELHSRLPWSPFTLAAVDTAILDVAGTALGLPISVLLGGRHRQTVEVHGSVGWDEDMERLVETAQEQAARFRVLKLYAGRGRIADDLDRLDAVRAAVGDDHPFIVDVNCLWTSLQAMAAGARLRDAGVVLLEQPLSPNDDEGMSEVTRVLGAQHVLAVAADEGVMRPADVARVAGRRSARVVNLGVSKLGGLVAALDAVSVATASGLAVLVGSVVELGVAAAAGLHLAASVPELPYPSYLMGPLKYVQQITWPPLVPEDSRLPVPTAPGLGVEVDLEAVKAMDLRGR
jgi:L-alanine-DL-glutamate epimerase-like enolase superfamily enzyme